MKGGFCMEYLPRLLDSILHEYLDTFGAVLIKGPKWCGKTTTAEKFAKSVVKLQDPRQGDDIQRLSQINPGIVLKGKYPRLIDEWQLVPKLWDAVRSTVDEGKAVGMFLLTGSAVPLAEPTRHTGTGRIARLLMRPMSLFESKESTGTISLSELFDGHVGLDGMESKLTIEALAYAICRGGWPASIGKPERNSLLIARDYVESLCESDISRIDGIERNPLRVRSLLRSYARNISTLAANTKILADLTANDSTMSETTMYEYLNVLERLFIIEDIPAWNPSIRSRTAIRSSNKKGFVDPSIAAAALYTTPGMLLGDLRTFGFLFESLVIRDLRIYTQRLGGEIFYYHDRYGLECDAVIRLPTDKFALCEVKLGGSEIDSGAAHLLELKGLLAKHGMRAPDLLLVITAGTMAYRREDGVYVVPVGCLRD